MKRRDFIRGGIAAGAAAALPARLPAMPTTLGPRDRKLAELAREQLGRAGDAIWRNDIVGIADFGLRSSEPRFHFVNLEAGTVDSYLVSHGTGSDPEHDGWLNWYSNQFDSNCTSRGAYVTWEWYTGRYGTSVRLGGLDPDNSNALPRAIVMHQASYAEPGHLERWGRLGRSNGCFAMGHADFQRALLQLSGGRLLYADSLGLGPSGERITRPEAGNLEPLVREGATGIERMNPGVY